MNRTLLSLVLLSAGLAGAVSPVLAQERAVASTHAAASVSVPDPARQITDLAQKFRAGDLSGLAQSVVPPEKWRAARAAYERKRAEPTTEEDRARFAEKFARITSADAVDQFMADIEPKLARARPQLPGALLMGFGAMAMAIDSPESDLTPAERAALKSAMPGLQRWANGTDFLSSATMRRAVGRIVDAARSTGITDIDQLKSLPLEGVLERAAPVFTAAKEAVGYYGIDLDAIAATLKVDVLNLETATARVRTTVTVFGAPVSSEHDLVLVEGRWYDKDALVHFDEELDDDVES
ncbi:hypothetical protein [Tahibacter amnicola]|uniref:DUF2059 domain-containing protein n=1 Tax=Tahibacter amnicola TaxID=2976241 RepID=A0ABY6BJZ2_9GAMM|nr:hypothetical protein [Tahibacter amnicola]UXI70185.1 hypothetical protein N4264_11300 [Tahibacter amnicola]